MSSFVLDASALLAYLHEEPGTEIVENALVQGVYISQDLGKKAHFCHCERQRSNLKCPNLVPHA